MLLCRVPEAGSGAHQAVRPQDGSDEGDGHKLHQDCMSVPGLITLLYDVGVQ